MTDYPSIFPEPMIDGYTISVDMGVVRTNMETGRSKQRRRYRDMPSIFTLEFAITLAQLGSWQTWVNAYAYQYFTMDMVSYTTSNKVGANCSPHTVRFISDLSLTPINANAFRVSVMAEVAPIESFTTPPVILTDKWIIAGDPANPSALDVTVDQWIVAGIPSATYTDWVVAGSPSGPAALV